MFNQFKKFTVEIEGLLINYVIGGSGPAILLLHGYPQTHVMWHKVADQLAEHYTVVASDLRGYGDSDKPPTNETHTPYSKRASGNDQVKLMQLLGFNKFGCSTLTCMFYSDCASSPSYNTTGCAGIIVEIACL